jgi:hypothetical protein
MRASPAQGIVCRNTLIRTAAAAVTVDRPLLVSPAQAKACGYQGVFLVAAGFSLRFGTIVPIVTVSAKIPKVARTPDTWKVPPAGPTIASGWYNWLRYTGWE